MYSTSCRFPYCKLLYDTAKRKSEDWTLNEIQKNRIHNVRNNK